MNVPGQSDSMMAALSFAGEGPDLDTSTFYGKPDPLSRSEKFVVFSLNGVLYGIPAGRIAEVTHPLKTARLPGAPEWFNGLGNLRGEAVAVFNLKKLWKEEITDLSERSKMIVLRSIEGETVFAFQVDKLNEIVTLFDSDIQPTADRHRLTGIVPRETGTLNLIDVTKLRASLVFE